MRKSGGPIRRLLQESQGETREDGTNVVASLRPIEVEEFETLFWRQHLPASLIDMKGKREKRTKGKCKHLPWATRCKRLREKRVLIRKS